MLKILADNGMTIFLSSHILAELAKICTKIGIIYQGILSKELKTTVLEKQRIKKLIFSNNNLCKTIQLLKSKKISSRLNQVNEIEIEDANVIANPAELYK